MPNPVFSKRVLLVIPDNFLGGFEAPLIVFDFTNPLFKSVLEPFQVPPAAACVCVGVLVDCFCLRCLLLLLGFACLALFDCVLFAWGPAGEPFL